MDEAEIRAPLEQGASAEAPPSRVDAGLARIRGRSRLRRRRAPQCAAAAVAVIAVAIPAGPGVPGHAPGLAAAHRPAAQTVYVAYPNSFGAGRITPISTATNRPGKPIGIGTGIPAEEMVFIPDGKTAYVANGEGPTGRVIPISTATGTPGKPVRIGVGTVIAITPDGKTVYAAAIGKVVPISTATNTPGKSIRHVGHGLPNGIVITP